MRALALAVALAASPALAEDASPAATAVFGAVTTMSADAGTKVTPTVMIDVESCLAVKDKCPLDFFGRVGISSAPGQSVLISDPQTFKSAEVGFGVALKVGDAGGVTTALVVEGGFLTRLPDAAPAPGPVDKVAHYLIVGARIRAKANGNNLVVGFGRDQVADIPDPASTLPTQKGLQGVIYGSLDVPSTNGVVTLFGDATVNVVVPQGSQKRDVVRIGVGLDVARMIAIGKQPPAPAPAAPDKMVARPSALANAALVGPPAPVIGGE